MPTATRKTPHKKQSTSSRRPAQPSGKAPATENPQWADVDDAFSPTVAEESDKTRETEEADDGMEEIVMTEENGRDEEPARKKQLSAEEMTELLSREGEEEGADPDIVERILDKQEEIQRALDRTGEEAVVIESGEIPKALAAPVHAQPSPIPTKSRYNEEQKRRIMANAAPLIPRETGIKPFMTDTSESDMPGVPSEEQFDAPAQDMSIISRASEAMDSLHGDLMLAMTRVTEIGTRMEGVEASLREIKEDKNVFMTAVMDRIRALERNTPHDPTITTPSAALSSVAQGTTTTSAPHQHQTPASLEDLWKNADVETL